MSRGDNGLKRRFTPFSFIMMPEHTLCVQVVHAPTAYCSSLNFSYFKLFDSNIMTKSAVRYDDRFSFKHIHLCN